MKPISINKKCAIFDFDGTIADTNSIHAKAFQMVFELLYIDNFHYEEYMGRKTIEVFKDFFHTHNLNYSEDKIVQMVKLKQSLARELMLTQLVSYDGAISFLKLLKQKGKILVLATSSSREGVSVGLKKLGIYEQFDYILTGDDVKMAKPDPEIFLKSLQLVNVKADEAVVIEDSLSGALAAQRANIEVIIVNNRKMGKSYYFTSYSKLINELIHL
ncbi:beta-phosphoglucomutase [Lachnotalea glycerini]|jgi:HAD superfamily hydrolase (TIGR01509 family)|uniref:Beta-phosphoglucomutase n=1 Tax=Lachnotalea glycerini TaxID=1763509 RepID=A0A255IQ82_9FIRM|nr:HAD family phosphatase [Lachnotalea glycerini]PXV95617.1 beta-phosphoglucomutase [Lachnotalea glycerini]RDY32907.1 HAD family phosphatase [Lachnotalea glycerini]